MAGDSPRPARPPALPAALGLVPFFLRSLRLPCPPRAAFGRRASRPNGRLEAPISGRQGASPGAALANRRGPRPRVAGGSTRAAAAAEEQLASQQPASRREPPPSHRKRKEQKVPDPLDLTGRDLAPPCRFDTRGCFPSVACCLW